ncbi:YCII domain-containing protein [Rubrivivax sp. A210]|nr:YCII domain-containing protein [Rubrivivax sp. A210]
MKEFILFMYNDALNAEAANDGEKWDNYFSNLHATGRFDGGSFIGLGLKFQKGQADQMSETDMDGIIRVRAESMAEAKVFLIGNPTYEAGGTVEIRELPRDE